MTNATLFGMLIIDRDPFVYADFWGLVQAWFQDAGGFAALGLFAYLAYALSMPAAQAESAKARAGVSPFMLSMAVLALILYTVYAFLVTVFPNIGPDLANAKIYASDPGQYIKYVPPKFAWNLQPMLLMVGGVFALLGIGEPFARSLAKVRLRRLWALTKLSFLEAIRSKVLWVFLIALIPFMFPAKWFFPIKAEDELRSTVAITTFFMNFILLVPAGFLAAFSIPSDIKNQNIYTIVTKPVERFELVFGRFIGYTILMTAALVAMTTVSWLFIRTTGVDEKAKEETLKARVPLRGSMKFQSRKAEFAGTNVGREFDYRQYIAGDPSSPQRAIWSFNSLPSGITEGRDFVPCEFTFDIFQMTKGVENRGVDLVVRVVSWQSPQVPPTEMKDGTWKWVDTAKEQQYQDEAKQMVRELKGLAATDDVNPASALAIAKPGTKEWEIVNKLTEKYGFYEITGKEIFDYHPESIAVPVGIFKNALKDAPKPTKENPKPALVQVQVKCNTPGQMLGMAEGDLYLLEGERTFDENYFKAAFGLWCRLCFVIGLAVTCSTYLAGIISFLAMIFIYGCGYAVDHISDMASGTSYAGGPLRAVKSLLGAEQPTAQVDAASAIAQVTEGGDKFFSWVVRRFVNMIPDVYSFSWSGFVSEGFNVPVEYLVMNLVVMVGYLLPWFILGYYLIRSREVAE